MIKRDIDLMPEEVVEVLGAMWMIAKRGGNYGDIPNAETIAALDETDYNTYNSTADLLKSLSRFEDEEP
jgi:hypothetical protein